MSTYLQTTNVTNNYWNNNVNYRMQLETWYKLRKEVEETNERRMCWKFRINLCTQGSLTLSCRRLLELSCKEEIFNNILGIKYANRGQWYSTSRICDRIQVWYKIRWVEIEKYDLPNIIVWTKPLIDYNNLDQDIELRVTKFKLGYVLGLGEVWMSFKYTVVNVSNPLNPVYYMLFGGVQKTIKGSIQNPVYFLRL